MERWAEDSGNAALAGRELPPDQVLAADERITARARELKAAGLEGGTDELRARALLDLLLGQDSRPRQDQGTTPGAAPAGFASRVTLTAPLGHPDPPRRPARRAIRARPGRPLADPRPGHRRRAEPEDHLVPDRHRQPGPRYSPRLRPARTQQSQETRRPRRARRTRVRVRGHGRSQDLAAAHPRTRTRPDRHDRPDHHGPLRPPAPSQAATTPAPGSGTCPRSGTPPAPAPSAAAPPPSATWSTTPRMRQADAPASATPARSAATTIASSSTPNGSRPASRWHLPVDHPSRAHLHHRTHPLPHLNPAAALARGEGIHDPGSRTTKAATKPSGVPRG